MLGFIVMIKARTNNKQEIIITDKIGNRLFSRLQCRELIHTQKKNRPMTRRGRFICTSRNGVLTFPTPFCRVRKSRAVGENKAQRLLTVAGSKNKCRKYF